MSLTKVGRQVLEIVRRFASDEEKRDEHGRWTTGGGLSGGEEKSLAEINEKFPRASKLVDGREVGTDIPNMDSIASTLDTYDVLPGVREVSMHDMDPHASSGYKAKDDSDRVDALATKIQESNRIDPLILVIDSERHPYVLEGGHRFSALKKLGAKSFPAKIVIDRTDSPSGVYFKDAAQFQVAAEQPRDDHGRWTTGGVDSDATTALARSSALRKIGQMKPDDKGFVHSSKVFHVVREEHVSAEDATREGDVVKLAMRDVAATQDYLDTNKLRGLVQDYPDWDRSFTQEEIEKYFEDPSQDGPVLIVDKGPKSYVVDGHHRAAAAKLLGVRIKVTHVKEGDAVVRRDATFNPGQERDKSGQWTSGGSADVQGKLDALTESHGRDIPSASIFPKVDENHEAQAVWASMPSEDSQKRESINPRHLIATQDSVDADGVQHYLDGTGQFSTEPTVLKLNKKYFVVDGHHRVAAAILSGKKSIDIEVHDGDAFVRASEKNAAAGVPRGVTLREVVGPTRTEVYQGKDYVVLPIVALVEGVIWPINSPHPDMVPEMALRLAPGAWDGRPVMAGIGHPVKDGTQVSANTPDMLTTSIGLVFNAHVDGKRLVMEAWIDPTMPEAQEVLARVNAGQLVEVSVGVLVVEEATPGVWEGKPYFAIWRVILPDHLAILPEGDEGACSGSMGCGIRAATKRVHLVTAAGVELTEEAVVKVTDEKMAEFLKTAVDVADPFKELHACAESVCVYETATGKMYRQSFEAQADETVKFVGDRLEVEPVMYFEPAGVDLKAAKGARHSQTDMARIQAMHDHTVDLGAECAAAPKTAAAAPCGCKHKETNMARTAEQRTTLITSLKSKLKPEVVTKLTALAGAKGDIIDAIIAQIKDKLGLSDAAAADIANLDEATIVELAGLATAEPKVEEASAAVPAAAAVKPETEAEFLSRNPELNRVVTAARSRNDARKAHLVGVLKTAQTHFKEAELLKMDVDRLEEVAVLCKANVIPDVDFGVQAPRVAVEEQDGVSPEPIDLGARIKAARAKK